MTELCKSALHRALYLILGVVIGVALTLKVALGWFDRHFDHEHVPQLSATDLDGMISLPSVEAVAHLRSRVIERIWGKPTLDGEAMPGTAEAVADPRFRELRGLARHTLLTWRDELGFSFRFHHFRSEQPNNRLMVYHLGHEEGGAELYAQLYELFLKKGYDVLVLMMPGLGENSAPPIIYANGEPVSTEPAIRSVTDLHWRFGQLESEAYTPIRLFLEPIRRGLNWSLAEHDYDDVSAMGLSGGGWTVTLYAALDRRVRSSYPVAGSMPLYLRTLDPLRLGDWEQIQSDIYHRVNYLQLYALATDGGRRQMQILNKYDSCCFRGSGALSYAGAVSQTAERFGGKWELWLDDTHKGHRLSQAALARILADLEAHRP